MPRWHTQDQSRLWDVAIIGAGMGGGVAARSLAEAGLDVLLIDRGHEAPSPAAAHHAPNDHVRRLAEGAWPVISTFKIDGIVSRIFGPYGSGIGGTTNLYAAALERFERHDIDVFPDIPHPSGGWVIHYSELLPYYVQAERMLHVAGTRDPLNPDPVDHLREPPPLGPQDSEFMNCFAACGLHPYRLHVGIRYRPGCDECIARLCHHDCRADARSVLSAGKVEPTILDCAEALRLKATADRVSSVVLSRDGGEIEVSAKIFVVAAGAIHTPKLLLNSSSEYWPEGIANRSGMVGRNLMFHAVKRFVIWPGKRLAASGPRKSLGLRDFYHVDGERLGSVQSTALYVTYGDILVLLYRWFDRSRAKRLRILRPLLRIPAAFIAGFFGAGTIFACHIEDFPYPENRVVLDPGEPDGIRIEYTIKEELHRRAARLRALLERKLKGRRMFFLSQKLHMNLGHPCGTCVMGADPAASVVDRDCRAHGVANLFIADASFMPTSSGTNPALTIAANALRVSEVISRVLDRGAVVKASMAFHQSNGNPESYGNSPGRAPLSGQSR